jgi:hypothetical protein
VLNWSVEESERQVALGFPPKNPDESRLQAGAPTFLSCTPPNSFPKFFLDNFGRVAKMNTPTFHSFNVGVFN